MARLRYKFVEVQPVTAAALEGEVNRWVADGWRLDQVRFVGEAGRGARPALAFVSFVRDDGGGVVELGELDLGAAEPFEVEVDWTAARARTVATRAVKSAVRSVARSMIKAAVTPAAKAPAPAPASGKAARATAPRPAATPAPTPAAGSPRRSRARRGRGARG